MVRCLVMWLCLWTRDRPIALTIIITLYNTRDVYRRETVLTGHLNRHDHGHSITGRLFCMLPPFVQEYGGKQTARQIAPNRPVVSVRIL